MLALTLLEEIGVLAGVIIFALVLVVILRPLTLHVTVRHENGREEKEEE